MKLISRRLLLVLFALAAWGWGATALGKQIVQTPDGDLKAARECFGRGTNALSKGKYREAEANLDTALLVAQSRLWELERRTESFGLLRTQAEIIREARGHFDEDWTGALARAESIRKPLRWVSDAVEIDAATPIGLHSRGLFDMKIHLSVVLSALDSLQSTVAAGNRREARDELDAIQAELDAQIEACTALQPLGGDFRKLCSDGARLRKKSRMEEARVLDVNQALAVIRTWLEQADGKIGRESWPDAAFDLDLAKTGLEDVRRSGQAPDEADVLASILADLERQYWCGVVRHHLGRARHFAETGSPYARRELESVHTIFRVFLSNAGGEECEALVREAEELDAAAERMLLEAVP